MSHPTYSDPVPGNGPTFSDNAPETKPLPGDGVPVEVTGARPVVSDTAPVDEPREAQPVAPPEDPNKYTFVKTDNGWEKMLTADLEKAIANQSGPRNAGNAPTPPAPETEFWIHLADGSSPVKVKESELPGYAGTNAPYGFYDRDGDILTITNVFPA